MIQKNQLELFWNFLYGIGDLSIPKKGNPHHSVAKDILWASALVKKGWGIDKLEIDDPLDKNKKIKDFIKLQSKSESIAGHIKTGKLPIRTFNAILCYFFFSIARDYQNPKESIPYLKDLIIFFDIIEAKSLPIISNLHTEAFINHLLKKIKLIGIRPELSPNFKLSFFQFNDQGIEIELSENRDDVPFEKSPLEVYKGVALYKEELKNEFKEIRVGFDGFPIPINEVVELPFFIIDKRIEENKNLLENELKHQQKVEDSQDLLLINELKEEIAKIDTFLNKENTPFEVLDKKQDTFILSPAGSGKTTILKWIAYKLSHQNKQLPVFIELQSYNSDLLALIKYSLKRFKLSLETIKNIPLILLIDGFDEYSGKEESTLIREIRDFKKDYNCQIIFSGRYKPVTIGEKEFITYRLSEFNFDDIKRVFKNVFPEKGINYYDKLHNGELLMSRPKIGLQLIIKIYATFLCT
ncbi:MAG: AAA family ATPase [Flavobacteriaceae bacterium]|nr:MAG: AAA family ATPase [Flavobacteriaceae bacterium]